MHIVVTGGTGFIGQRVVRHLLNDGHSVTVVSRDSSRVRAAFGDAVAAAAMDALPASFDAAINLAGESVAQRWTPEAKRRITDSRVGATLTIRQAAEKAGAHTLINASAVGYYGDRDDETLTEDSGPGKGFLAESCQAWEAAAESATLRVVRVRIGFVVGPGSMAIRKMALPFKLFMGGAVAGGGQFVPWIHMADVAGIMAWALQGAITGAVNATAPAPVTNRELSQTLARALRRPCWAPVPAFAIKLLFGEMGTVVLDSARAVPSRALAGGYRFAFTDLTEALRDTLAGD